MRKGMKYVEKVFIILPVEKLYRIRTKTEIKRDGA